MIHFFPLCLDEKIWLLTYATYQDIRVLLIACASLLLVMIASLLVIVFCSRFISDGVLRHDRCTYLSHCVSNIYFFNTSASPSEQSVESAIGRKSAEISCHLDTGRIFWGILIWSLTYHLLFSLSPASDTRVCWLVERGVKSDDRYPSWLGHRKWSSGDPRHLFVCLSSSVK